MITAVVGAFLDAKMLHPRTSAALYAVSADVDGTRISRQLGTRLHLALAGLLASASNAHHPDPRLLATILYGAMIGVSRVLLESPHPAALFPQMREELIRLACAYLDAPSTPTSSWSTLAPTP